MRRFRRDAIDSRFVGMIAASIKNPFRVTRAFNRGILRQAVNP
jgi:hypothetical protein